LEPAVWPEKFSPGESKQLWGVGDEPDPNQADQASEEERPMLGYELLGRRNEPHDFVAINYPRYKQEGQRQHH